MLQFEKVTSAELLKRFPFHPNSMHAKEHIQTERNFFLLNVCNNTLVFDEPIDDKVDGIVWCVLKNADFTEGRGPMRLHKIFNDIHDAVNYIMSQSGIYGSRQQCQLNHGINVKGMLYAYHSFNGYDLTPMVVE